jgi:hypothetical protein
MYAVQLRNGKWAVRPKGQLGTCGWHPYPWTVFYVTAINEQEAIRKAAAREARFAPSGRWTMRPPLEL